MVHLHAGLRDGSMRRSQRWKAKETTRAAAFRGTPRYASLGYYNNAEYRRADDVESWVSTWNNSFTISHSTFSFSYVKVYMAVEITTANIPWKRTSEMDGVSCLCLLMCDDDD